MGVKKHPPLLIDLNLVVTFVRLSYGSQFVVAVSISNIVIIIRYTDDISICSPSLHNVPFSSTLYRVIK